MKRYRSINLRRTKNPACLGGYVTALFKVIDKIKILTSPAAKPEIKLIQKLLTDLSPEAQYTTTFFSVGYPLKQKL